MTTRATILAFVLAATPVAAMSELDRTWAAAMIRLPGVDAPMSPSDLPARTRARGVILYAHGCDGPSRITTVSARFLAAAGYAVVAPDSFARARKPRSCDPAVPRGGLHRAVLGWRLEELDHALDRIRSLTLFDGLPIAMMGHSEGAIAVARMTAPGVALRIIEGWTCHAGWPEYHGLEAPPDQPVLSLVAADDPWFRLPVLQGDCGAFMPAGGPMRSVVFSGSGDLSRRHWLSADGTVQATILDFLSRHMPYGEE